MRRARLGVRGRVISILGLPGAGQRMEGGSLYASGFTIMKGQSEVMKPSSASVLRIVKFIRMKRIGQVSMNIVTVDAAAFSACSPVSNESYGSARRAFSRFSTCLWTVRKNAEKWSPRLFDFANIAVA